MATPASTPTLAAKTPTPAAMTLPPAQAGASPNATSSAIPAGPEMAAASTSGKPKRKLNEAFGSDKTMSLTALKKNLLKVKGRIIDTNLAVQMLRNAKSEKEQLEQALAQKTANDEVAGASNHTAQLLAQAREETEALQRKLQVADSSIAELTTKGKAMDMLNTQLTEKARAADKLEAELAEARKNLAKANKEREQASRKLSESREAIMKMEAEKMSRAKWLEGEKKKWEEKQETRLGELQDHIRELQEEVEDLKENGQGDEMAVDFLEASMIKDELVEVRSELEQKIDQLRKKTTELEQTAGELRTAKETMEEMKVTIEALEQNQADDFEEVIPGQKSTGSAATTLHQEASTEAHSLSMTQPVQSPRPTLAQVASLDQMNSALRSLDDLKSQFSILSWTHDSTTSEQTIAALESKVMELTKEKESLQHELLQRVMAPPTALETKVNQLTKEKEALQHELLQRVMEPPTDLESKVSQLTKEKEALQQDLLQRIMAPAPVNLEAKVLQLTREKEALQQELVQRIMVSPAQPTTAVQPTHRFVELHAARSDIAPTSAAHQVPEKQVEKPNDGRANATRSVIAPPSAAHQVPEKQVEKPNDEQALDLTLDMDVDLTEIEPRRAHNRSAVHPLDLDGGLQSDWGVQEPTQSVPGPSMTAPPPRKTSSSSESSVRTAQPSLFMPRSTSTKKLGKKAPPPNLINMEQANLNEAGSSKPTVRKQAKPRSTKKAGGSKLDQLLNVEIRNISTNPFIPDIANPNIYFSVLMNSAIVHDSQPNTKLSTVATVLPQKLDVLFEAVYDKAKEITPKVVAFRTSHDNPFDNCKKWTLEGQTPIKISESLSPSEINVVQLLCVLAAHFHEMEIIPKFLKFAFETIIQEASKNVPIDALSVLVRITTGICRAQDELDQAHILGFDILREISKRDQVLILCEAVASIWPEVFMDPEQDERGRGGRRRVISEAIQAIVGTIQDEINEEEIVLAHGYDTFVTKCNWPTLDEAPYVDELTEQLMATIQEPEYAQMSPDVQFAHRKALELLLVQGYSWAELFEKYIKTSLIKMLAEPEKRTIALTLLAALLRSFYEEARQCLPLQPILDGILTEEANGVMIL
ncbi:hypothetical protein BGZ75_008249 [Mortierella antarctica]|nr:hypothetical protein BGZ75_008249 [Mortierella antarctica]